MKQIYNWTAYRSGASLTIKGVDAQGNPVVVTGICSIVGGAKLADVEGLVIAYPLVDSAYELATLRLQDETYELMTTYLDEEPGQ